MICVNNPDFNDIGREVFHNGAWEAWLTNHIVKAMLNYPGAVLLGQWETKLLLSLSMELYEEWIILRYRVQHWPAQPDCGRHGEGGDCAGRRVLQPGPDLHEPQDDQQGPGQDPLQLHQ